MPTGLSDPLNKIQNLHLQILSLIVLSAPYKKNLWEIVWYWRQWQIYIVTFWTHVPGITFFIFMQFTGKFWPNIRLALPLGLGTPLGNPGSVPGKVYLTHKFENVQMGPIILSATYRAGS